MRSFLAGALAALSLAACSGGGDTGGTTSTAAGGSGGQAPIDHPAMPQVINVGGQVLAHPKVQAIVYDSDPHAAAVDDFLADLSKSSYWSETTGEYGVGALEILPTIKRTGAAPASITDGQIVDDLDNNTSGVAAPWGAPDDQAIYLFIMPAGTVVQAGGPCCQAFDGYHDEASLSNASAPYAVVCSCPGFDGPGVNDVQQVTIAASHEIIEASTDPRVNSAPAFYQSDDADPGWTMATGGEVADMCELDDASYIGLPGTPYMVQRAWSNEAAKAGKWPCVPAASTQPYFAATAVLADKITITGWPEKVGGAILGVGQSRTFAVKLWSSGALAGPIQVKAVDVGEYLGTPSNLELSLDKDTGNAGDTLELTVKLKSVDKTMGVDVFVLEAHSGADTSLSMGAVNTH